MLKVNDMKWNKNAQRLHQPILTVRHPLQCCRETYRSALKQLGGSWKKARKLLNKVNLPGKTAIFYLEVIYH
jgi:hypothetical protein